MSTFSQPWNKPFAQHWSRPVGEISDQSPGLDLDANAEAWINARAAMGQVFTDVQKMAVSNFVIAEKAANRWTKLKRLYLFTAAGNASANAIDMKSLTPGTFVGSVTHFAGYSQATTAAGYFNTNTSMTVEGITTAGAGMGWIGLGELPSQTSMSIAGVWTGASDGFWADWTGTVIDGLSFYYGDGSAPTKINTGYGPSTYTRGIISLQYFGTGRAIYRRTELAHQAVLSNVSPAPTGVPSTNVAAMALLTDGTAVSGQSAIKMGAFFLNSGWDQADDSAFTANLKILYYALGGLTITSLDPHAESFFERRIAAGDLTLTAPNKVTIENFIIAEKAAGRWQKLSRLYLFTSGVQAANQIDMVGIINGSFVGGTTHSAVGGYFAGNGTNGYFSTVTLANAPTVGLTTASGGFGYLSVGGQTGTSVIAFGCVTGANSIMADWTTTNGVEFHYNNSTLGTGLIKQGPSPITNASGIVTFQRFGTGRFIGRRVTAGYTTLISNTSANAASVPGQALYLGAFNSTGTANSFNVARYGLFWIDKGWSSADDTAFTASVKTLWETITGLTLTTGLDPDTEAFITTSSATDATNLNNWVLGLKSNSLWNFIRCFPMRSSQNITTGTTVYGLGGLNTLNGTLAGAPARGADGITFLLASNQRMDVTIANFTISYAAGGAFTMQTTGGGGSCIIAINGNSAADSMQINDATTNTISGGHRTVAGSTYVSPPNQTYVVGTPTFIVQGWEGANAIRITDSQATATVVGATFGGAIAPLRVNCRGDALTHGQNKICHMAFYMVGNGGSATQYQTIRTLYKNTIGAGLALPIFVSDPDADAWLVARAAAGDTLTQTQMEAVEAFVLAEKAAGRWTNIKRIYLPTTGIPAANAIDLKTGLSGTWVGSGITHGAGFVQSTGAAGWFDLGTSFDAEGLGLGSAHLWILQLTPNTGTAGAVGLDDSALSQNDLRFTATSAIFRWAGNLNSVSAVTDRLGFLSASRFGGRRRIFQRKASGPVTLANVVGTNSGVVSTANIEALRTGILGSNFNDAQVGAFGFGRGMNIVNNNAFTANLKTLWEALTGLTIP